MSSTPAPASSSSSSSSSVVTTAAYPARFVSPNPPSAPSPVVPSLVQQSSTTASSPAAVGALCHRHVLGDSKELSLGKPTLVFEVSNHLVESMDDTNVMEYFDLEYRYYVFFKLRISLKGRWLSFR
ncbi:hypothetical protein L1987_23978 [Smallanthus sonchifolius]|uniref:Uncharacterized protein n=1 Tax=Smallanthus sonchifolius TaxID=185202 RepID=A0ACB9IJS3_9ASTR|nr:hypothetical protein L1987_23978 [Smallanthus sonchifolius]